MSLPTILVIEDNVADQVLIRIALDELGEPYEFQVLPDGEAALAFVADHRAGRRKHDPCVILLDLHLPKYNGIEVLTAIRGEPILDHIHVFIMTTDISPAQRAQVAELGGLGRMIRSPRVQAQRSPAARNLCAPRTILPTLRRIPRVRY